MERKKNSREIELVFLDRLKDKGTRGERKEKQHLGMEWEWRAATNHPPYTAIWHLLKNEMKRSTIIYGQNTPFSESTIPRSTNVSTRCHSICTELLRLLQACSSTFHSSHFSFLTGFHRSHSFICEYDFIFNMQRKILLRVYDILSEG